MNAYVTGDFYSVFFIFLTLWFLPFLFLSYKGLRLIGFKKPDRKLWLILALLTGAGMSSVVYIMGEWLYGDSVCNWFVYISRSNGASGSIEDAQRLIFFLISAVMSMTFSPIGEELFYRGLIHGALQVDFGHLKASYIDSLAFALTHLAHYGIIYNNQS
ncbi:CAAX amino terminal protease self- immunity [Salinivirga cyanobacteriivorans]|uniref:CAAX amino terminal protease self-immunity n=1 Tax=Salinivirga cyanobacteriivorans TaxID=1307839 RepID=A0A0S2HWS5_9BACT|nr:CPBP family intramembrane glutamic endopeptidase [Salinivirga cyanobacteriivorans]ALO14506.1 CAAX amino terminal protease self- immunity [Salinivirga cyanobacteriivorans]